jgi:hypothetical protein
MKTLLAITLCLLAVPVLAKDKTYETGTVDRETVQAGWTDSANCSGSVGYVHCSGGISDDYATVYHITLDDGTRIRIVHVPLTKDTLKHVDFSKGAATVQYRKVPHVGTFYLLIEDPSDPSKAGRYAPQQER